jgi:hypothetical protein
MWDPIEGRADFVFFTLGLALFLWIAIDPRRALQILLLRPKPPTVGESYLARMISIFNSIGLALVLMWHMWRLIRVHLGMSE